MIQPPLSAIPAHLINVAQYERQAQTHLDDQIWAYVQGGAMDEHTLNANLAAWQNLQLVPRRLQSLRDGHTRLTLFGQTWAHPMMFAPIAYQQLFHPDAELATAQASQVTHTPMMVSSLASRTFADIAAHTTQPLWLQLYWQANRADTQAVVARAEAAGFAAVVLTVDAPHSGVRDRERLAQFMRPADVQAVNLPPTNPRPPNTDLFAGLFAQAPTWDDVAWLKQRTRLPVLLKGILHPSDAKQAYEMGVDGLVVSNHGGRVLDGCITAVDALPAIRQVCPDPYPILVDSGIRRGSEVLKALALGASAVLIGRPYIYGLSVAGALGAGHVMKILHEELQITMGLCGCASVADMRQATVLLA